MFAILFDTGISSLFKSDLTFIFDHISLQKYEHRFFTTVLRTWAISERHVIERHLSDNRLIKIMLHFLSAIGYLISHEGGIYHFFLQLHLFISRMGCDLFLLLNFLKITDSYFYQTSTALYPVKSENSPTTADDR